MTITGAHCIHEASYIGHVVIDKAILKYLTQILTLFDPLLFTQTNINTPRIQRDGKQNMCSCYLTYHEV